MLRYLLFAFIMRNQHINVRKLSPGNCSDYRKVNLGIYPAPSDGAENTSPNLLNRVNRIDQRHVNLMYVAPVAKEPEAIGQFAVSNQATTHGKVTISTG